MNLLPGGILVAQPLFIPSPCEGLAVRFCRLHARATHSNDDRATRTAQSGCATKIALQTEWDKMLAELFGILCGDVRLSGVGKFGWGGWTRTNTVLINSEVSYQLDHAPVGVGQNTIRPTTYRQGGRAHFGTFLRIRNHHRL